MIGPFRREMTTTLMSWRLPVFLLVAGGYLTYKLYTLLADPTVAVASAWTVLPGLVEAGLLLVLGLAFLFSLDALSRERDSGMMAILRVTPITSHRIVAAKLTVLAVIYVAVALLLVAGAAVASFAVGGPLLSALLGFLGPLTLIFLFLAGLGLFISAATGSARTSFVVGALSFLPLWLTMEPDGPGQVLLYHLGAGSASAWIPLEAAYLAGVSTLSAFQTTWPPLVGAGVLGLVLAAVAGIIVDRREVSL